MQHIDELFSKITDQLIRNSRQDQAVDSERVFQPANDANRVLVDQIIAQLVLPGSTIDGYENLRELYRRSQRGNSCLILMEHYSNFDIPCLFYLADQQEEGHSVTDAIVAMAGTKLNEESRFILAFTEAYTRIVIYPARLLAALEGSDSYEHERMRSRIINRSALREMIRMKHSGHMVLLFPAGTRFRPGKPETRQALPEVDSYIKGFDHLVFIGIAGNTLEVSTDNMEKDTPGTDVMVYSVSEVTDAGSFRTAARAGATDDGMDAGKRAVAAAVEQRFSELHERAEGIRSAALRKLAEQGVEPRSLNITTPG